MLPAEMACECGEECGGIFPETCQDELWDCVFETLVKFYSQELSSLLGETSRRLKIRLYLRAG